MLSEEQRAAMDKWLREVEGLAPAEDEIVGTRKTLDYYIGCWGTPQETATLSEGTTLSIWRGDGYGVWVADFGALRAAFVF